MALEQLRLAPATLDAEESAAANGADVRQTPSGDAGEDGSRAPRLPRWTRQEILVLIQGKRVAENRVRRGRTAGMAFGSGQVEPKWASVSSYCKRHGVNRGPVQCRKRWSNLAGDYKKIKEWESQIREEAESFWVMRNDLRRERKLPGFFDKEVYDIIDGGITTTVTPTGLALALTPLPEETAAEEDVEGEAVFDSGRSAAADDGLFSDFEHSVQEEAGGSRSPGKVIPLAKDAPATTSTLPAPVPISEKQYQPFPKGSPSRGAKNGTQQQQQQQPLDPEHGTAYQEGGRKRKRAEADGDHETDTLQSQLIEVLERNGQMLSTQLEAQNANSQLDREQRKDHAGSLVAVLNKLADALGRIADKL